MNISPLWCPLVGGQSERGGRSPWLVQARWRHPHSHFEDLSKRTSLWSPKLIWTQNAETWGEREGEEKGSLSSNSLSGMSPSITVIGISQIYIFFSNLHIFKHTGLPWGSWTFPQPFRIKIQPIFQGSVQIPLSFFHENFPKPAHTSAQPEVSPSSTDLPSHILIIPFLMALQPSVQVFTHILAYELQAGTTSPCHIPLDTPHRIWHCLLPTSMAAWMEMRGWKERWYNALPWFLPGQSILTSAY